MNSLSSNMIKGYSVSYDTKSYKKLSFGEKEEEIKDLQKSMWLTKFPDKEFPGEECEADKADTSDTGFKAGIKAEEVEDPDSPAPLTEEEINDFKEKIRKEVEFDVRTQIADEVRSSVYKESAKILADAKSDAEKIIAEAVEKGKKDGEAAKAGIIMLASKEGYSDGLKRANTEKEAELNNLNLEKERLEADYQEKIAALEPEFTKILISYVKKITGIAYENHSEVIEYLISSAIKKCPKDERFEVKLSSTDYARIAPDMENIIERFKDKLSLTFSQSAALSEGSVILENDEKIIECGLETVTTGLLDALCMLSEA